MENGQTDNQELTIDQEYDLWKKNCHYMYDFVHEVSAQWPTLTAQWLPGFEDNGPTLKGTLLIGTNTSGETDELVKIGSAHLPKYISVDADSSKKDIKTHTKFAIRKQLYHYKSEVNRARSMPQNPRYIASISGEGSAYVYYDSPEKAKNKSPILKLNYHKENGFGLDWSPFKEGYLLTGADDKQVCLWDINYQKINSRISSVKDTEPAIEPKNVLNFHKDIVNDVKWHKFDENIFGSVSDDKSLHIYDLRDLAKPSIIKDNIHNDSINALAFSPFSKNIIATGGSDASIGLFDLRNVNQRLHSMVGHNQSITALEWSPHVDGFLASASEDRRVIIWDISKIGEEQNQDDADDGAPEVFMMHAGHTSLVTDLSWHPDPNLKWLLASVSDNNVVQFWKPAKNLTDPVDGWSQDEVNFNDLE